MVKHKKYIVVVTDAIYYFASLEKATRFATALGVGYSVEVLS